MEPTTPSHMSYFLVDDRRRCAMPEDAAPGLDAVASALAQDATLKDSAQRAACARVEEDTSASHGGASEC